MAQILKVSQIIGMIKNSLEGEFSNIVLEGEISNLSLASSGHYYFSLKDENAMISCAIFRSIAMRNPVMRQARDGMQVQVYGDISVYAKRGSFQLIVKKVVPVGQGSLKEKFERLKKKLAAQGLFDIARKQALPESAKKIGVVTALGAAALQDFLNIMKRRSSHYEIIIAPSLVQGDAAPKSLIKAFDKLLNIDELDVVVVTRGGGSLEDLWAFNDESLARYISDYPIPVISAVGHQVDFTLCDYVSDKRLETPSAAAEFLSQSQTQLDSKLEFHFKQLTNLVSTKLHAYQYQLSCLQPNQQIRVIENKVFKAKTILNNFKLSCPQVLKNRVQDCNYRLEQNLGTLVDSNENRLLLSRQKLAEIKQFINAVNPKKVLQRGYSYTTFGKSIINNKKQFQKIPIDQKIHIMFHDGSVEVKKYD